MSCACFSGVFQQLIGHQKYERRLGPDPSVKHRDYSTIWDVIEQVTEEPDGYASEESTTIPTKSTTIPEEETVETSSLVTLEFNAGMTKHLEWQYAAELIHALSIHGERHPGITRVQTELCTESPIYQFFWDPTANISDTIESINACCIDIRLQTPEGDIHPQGNSRCMRLEISGNHPRTSRQLRNPFNRLSSAKRPVDDWWIIERSFSPEANFCPQADPVMVLEFREGQRLWEVRRVREHVQSSLPGIQWTALYPLKAKKGVIPLAHKEFILGNEPIADDMGVAKLKCLQPLQVVIGFDALADQRVSGDWVAAKVSQLEQVFLDEYFRREGQVVSLRRGTSAELADQENFKRSVVTRSWILQIEVETPPEDFDAINQLKKRVRGGKLNHQLIRAKNSESSFDMLLEPGKKDTELCQICEAIPTRGGKTRCCGKSICQTCYVQHGAVALEMAAMNPNAAKVPLCPWCKAELWCQVCKADTESFVMLLCGHWACSRCFDQVVLEEDPLCFQFDCRQPLMLKPDFDPDVDP